MSDIPVELINGIIWAIAWLTILPLGIHFAYKSTHKTESHYDTKVEQP